MSEEKQRIFELLGVVAVGQASGISYQTISKFTKTGKVRSRRIEKQIVQGAVDLVNAKVQELSDTIELLEKWQKELK